MTYKHMKVKLMDIVPQQHYLSKEKFEKVSEYMENTKNYGDIYVIEYRGRLFSVDGHHRLFWLFKNNINEINVVCEVEDNNNKLYQKLADDSLEMGLKNISDLEHRFVNYHKDYERLWIDKCQLLLLSERDKRDYKLDPCRTSALPLFKEIRTNKKGINVIHEDHFVEDNRVSYSSHKRFFRLWHNLEQTTVVKIGGYSIRNVDFDCDIENVKQIINESYKDISITNEEINSMINDRVFIADMWIFVIDEKTNKEVALGICQFDKIVNEVVFDWIQVLPKYRGIGLGKMLVTYLIQNSPQEAEFATVSGDLDNPSSPEKLYRNCGFSGNDIWHIIDTN